MKNSVMIAVAEAKAELERALHADPSFAIEDRLRVAFKTTKTHWLVTDPDEQFQAGVAAVILLANEDEVLRLESEMKALASLSALMAGLDVNIPELTNPIGVIAIFKETP